MITPRIFAAFSLALTWGCDGLEPVPELDCTPICRLAGIPIRGPAPGVDSIDERRDPTLVMSLHAVGHTFSCDAIPLVARKADPLRPRFGPGTYGLRRSSCRPDAVLASPWFEVGIDQPEQLGLDAVQFDARYAVDDVNEFCLTKSARDLRGREDAPADDPSGAWWWSDIIRIERVCLPSTGADALPGGD